ncbi:18483_t:CDS:1, partial [Racocetra fulgida]
SQIKIGLDRIELLNSIAEGFSDKLDSSNLNRDLFEVLKAF